jgi:FdhD protein
MNAMTASEHAALVNIVVEKWCDDRRSVCHDEVAEEVPVALEYNGISHAVMLASPCHLKDFALGFSLSEGILSDISELYDCEISVMDDGIQVQMRIAAQRFSTLKGQRRNLTGRTGCGLCGAETLQQAIRRPPPVTSSAIISASSLYAGMAAMQAQQRMQQHTGATHAAAWLDADGNIDLVREDVGRHNALDKLIGAVAAERRDFSSGVALITSRASYEMVQKAATVGIGFLAAISAPTSLAVQLAEATNVTLVGFVRHQRHVVYAQSHRLLRDVCE